MATQLKKSRSMQPSGKYWMLYLLPALVIYVVFMAFPLIDSLRMSFFTESAGSASKFIGFQNYKTLFTTDAMSERYWGAFGNTLVFFMINMIFQNCLCLLFALILTNKKMQGRKTYQTIVFIPTTFAVLVTGYLWKLLLNPVWSGDSLTAIGLGRLVQPWLGQKSTALLSISLISCWQWAGIPTMMFVAALKNVPEDCLEVARIEGASAWQTFCHVKYPLIVPTVGMVSILTFTSNFNAFDIVFATETVNGSPNYATDLIGTFFYRIGIAGQHPLGIPNPSMGATIATMTFIVLLIGVLPTLKATQKDK